MAAQGGTTKTETWEKDVMGGKYFGFRHRELKVCEMNN